MKPWSNSIALTLPLRNVLAPGRKPGAESRGQAGATQGDANQDADENYYRGFSDGEKALSEKLFQQRSEMHQLAQGIFESLRKAVPQVMRSTESEMVSLAMAVAEKLVAGLPISAEMVESAVRDAVGQVEGTAQIVVRLHKDDLELLQKTCSPVLKPLDESSEIRFVPSAEVSRGGCLVETNFGTVDARRETKLELLKRSLEE